MKYNYLEAMRADILDKLKEDYTPGEIRERMEDRDQFERELNDNLWICDSVTGNASGSYTFNTWRAREYVIDNTDILHDALQVFGEDAETIAGKFLDDEWEYFDVTIRCYLLAQSITAALDEIEREQEDGKQ